MNRFVQIFAFALVSLLISSRAYAEFLPIEDEEGRLVEAEEAREYAAPRRRRAAEETQATKELSSEDRQRAKIERYLDEATSSRGVERRANRGRRGYRYDSETGYASQTQVPSGYSREPSRPSVPSQPGAFSFNAAPPERSYNRAFQAEAISATEPSVFSAPKEEKEPTFNRKQRWRVEEPAWTPPAPKKAEVSPNYPFDAERGPASEFAGAFEPKKNKSRQALLNVKKWMRGEEERVSREQLENQDDEDNTPTDFSARIGLLGGMSTLKNGTEQTTSSEASPANIYVGLFTDLHLGQYFGADIEGFYGIAPKLTEIEVSEDGASETETSRSVHHMGAMANLYLRYTLPLGSMTMVPKFGVGYGLLNLKASSATASAENTLNQNTSGLYWTAGVDFIFSDQFSLGVDYATTFNASGSISEVRNGNTASQAIEGAGFNRFRLSGYYKVSPKVSLGAQFVLRNLTAGSSASANLNGNVTKGTESLNQILGVLMFTL